MSRTREVDVLVIGAGPTGLAAAIEATRHGLRVHIVDAKTQRSAHSKALVVHARTLEAYESMGVAAAIRAAGVPFAGLNITTAVGTPPIRVDLRGLAWGDTRYPYWLSIPQYETERCLEEHLAAVGVEVAWRTAFVALDDRGEHVEVRLRGPDGADEAWRASWVIGADGGRSQVRETAGLGFTGSSLEQTFILADASGRPGLPEDEGAAVLADAGVIFVVPMPEAGRWRIIAHLQGHPAGAPVTIDAAYVDRLFAERMGIDFGARDLQWTSQFVLKQGIADRYRAGRVFIAGDAAHLHSPVGGQGLNTGAQDAHALGWRLALHTRGRPRHDGLLDSYEAERRAVAQAMVRATSRATRLITLRPGLLTAIRGRVARAALQLDRIQQRLGRGVGMLDLAIPSSPLVIDGPAGASGPGRRLPDPCRGAARLSERLDARRHSALIFADDARGVALAEELAAAGIHVVRVTRAADPASAWVDPEGTLQASLGGARVVIVRPDRIVAATGGSLDRELVDRYAEERVGVDPSAL
ncbi:MAG: FAD-dependent monooxygenase [Myxococcales bacterium]|nr:FAD-dependent monooxygenase [Myxococcales bacterium]